MNFVAQQRPKLISLMVLAMLLSVVSGFTSTKAEAEGTQKYSGEEMFAAIVFGQDDLAKSFPELWSGERYKEMNNNKNSKAVKTIINQIKNENPKYFDELKQAVYSKDFIKVKKLLAKGGEILDQTEVIKNSIAATSGRGSGQCVVDFVLVVDAGAFTDVVSVTHKSAWTTEKAWTSSSKSSKSQLKQEQLVKKLITSVNE